MKLRGKVVRTNDYGLFVVRVDNSKQQYAFTVKDIDGFRGESPREVGITQGSSVTVEVNDGIVVGATKG